ncbi:MAG: VOC family protein [Hyphomicrobiaceae bacterium]|nr:VOC family protein [Hyphomicrobiaceae bacterium]
MPLKHIFGVDHVVVTARDLDAAAETWRGLGFTLSPRGTHSALLGTANYTIMLREDYLELLSVLVETDQNKPTRDFLKEQEGIERTAFTTDDAAGGAAEIKARGFEPLGPVHFGRPVDLPDGSKSEARFNVFRWPLTERPGGMRIFACQHLTRETVWIPEIMTHANGATRIARVEILAADPEAGARHMSRLIDEPVSQAGPGVWSVPSGGRRAQFVFLSPEALAARYPAAVREGAAKAGAVALALATSDVARAAAALGTKGVAHDGAVSVPARAATGVIVSFVPE